MNGSILMRKHILAASVTHLYGIKRMVEHQSIQIREKPYLCTHVTNILVIRKKMVKYQRIVGLTLRRNHVIAVNVNYVLEDKTKLI